MSKTFFIVFIFSVLGYTVVFGQHVFLSDTLEIKEVSKTVSRAGLFSTGKSKTELSEEKIRSNSNAGLGELLKKYTSLSISTYGHEGGTSSISFRGFDGNQTKLVWNGMTLNSNTTGSTDISYIPSSLFNSVKVFNGGAASIFGSGSFGGTIELGYQPNFKEKNSLELTNSLGSFTTIRNHLNIKLGKDWIHSRTSFFQSYSKNNFSYKDVNQFRTPTVKQTHNTHENYAIVQDLFLKLPSQIGMDFHLWYQERHYEIPEIMGVPNPNSQEYQTDKPLYITANFKKRFYSSMFQTNLGYSNQYIHYENRDTAATINSLIESQNYSANLRYVYYQGVYKFDLGSELLVKDAQSTNYNIDPEHDFSFFTGIKAKFHKTALATSVRYVINSHKNSPVLYNIGINQNINSFLNIKSSFSTKYRTPTINEKYWQNVGNPNLPPEKGWDYELGLYGKLFFFNYEVTGYYAEIKDLISWVSNIEENKPEEWYPTSYKDVTSHGIESKLSFNQKFQNKSQLFIQLGANYNNIQNEKLIHEKNKKWLNKQLPYKPKLLLNAVSEFSTQSLRFGVNASYKSKVETSEDHSTIPLDDFFLMNTSIFKSFEIQKTAFEIGFEIKNILKTDYQVISSYAMPEIAYYLHIRLQLNNL